MRTVHITRIGDRSVTDQIAEMREWLAAGDTAIADLKAVAIIGGRVRFRAEFDRADDAEAFVRQFGGPTEVVLHDGDLGDCATSVERVA